MQIIYSNRVLKGRLIGYLVKVFEQGSDMFLDSFKVVRFIGSLIFRR